MKTEKKLEGVSMAYKPRSLEKQSIRENRLKMIYEDHIRPLNMFVEKIRKEQNITNKIPYFDPLDGGIKARCLCVLQEPGSEAIKSGFVSRNNPDKTAENIFNYFKKAGISRKDTVLWNIIPWKNKEEKSDFNKGVEYLKELIPLLPNLKAILFLGLIAQQAIPVLNHENLKFFKCWHPGGQAQNQPNKKEETLKVLHCLSAFLKKNE